MEPVLLIGMAFIGMLFLFTNRDTGYPTCFEKCNACRQVYDILQSYNLVSQYKKLFDLYSTVLCLQKDDELHPILNDIITKYGPPQLEPDSLYKRLGKHVEIQEDQIGLLILLITDHIEREINNLKEYDIKGTDFVIIEQLNEDFYKEWYPKLISELSSY